MNRNPKVTVAKVNKALAEVGPERLRRGKGYYYFSEGDSAAWYSSSVFVNNVDALTIEQWIAERNRLAGERALVKPTPKQLAYQAGFKAYSEREGVRDNPHADGTELHNMWYSGWRQADREDGN